MELQNDKDLVDYMPKWSSNLLMRAMSSRMSASLCSNHASEASALLRTVSNFCSRISILSSDSCRIAGISLCLARVVVVVASRMTTFGGGGSTAGDGDGSGSNGSGGGEGNLDLLQDEKGKSDDGGKDDDG
ncbi:hypothetical protein Tco_1442964, partial [Tanacetum coccineum]